MKKIITTTIALALTFGALATQQNDTMFVHTTEQTIFYIPTSDVDSIIFHSTGTPIPMGGIDKTDKIDALNRTIEQKGETIDLKLDSIGGLHGLLTTCEGNVLNLIADTLRLYGFLTDCKSDVLILVGDTIRLYGQVNDLIADTTKLHDSIGDLHTAISYLRIRAMGCNSNEPGWGADGLGTITWGNTTNTDINDLTSTVVSNDPDRPTQIWSGAVFATACDKGNQNNDNAFAGGDAGNSFNADCRQSYHTFRQESREYGITGDFFSWCAVIRFADTLCPYPWRVPTTEDFAILHQNLDFTLPGLHASVPHNNGGHFMPAGGTAQNPQVGGFWGGARFTGRAADTRAQSSVYWTSTEVYASNARALLITETVVHPQRSNNKGNGFALRCVRDVP